MQDPWIDQPWNRRTARRVVLVALAGLLLSASSLWAGPFAAWTYRMTVTFKGYTQAETLTNFPALVVLSNNVNGSGFGYDGFASATGDDLRFTASDGTTELNYEIERWDTNGTSYVWVQVPALTGTNSQVLACWGNPAATRPAYTTNGATWSDGYLGVWHLADMADASMYGRDGTDSGSAGVTGIVGLARSFFNSHIALPSIPFGTAFTVSMWIKPSELYNWGCPFGEERRATFTSFADQDIWFTVGNGSSWGTAVSATTGRLNAGQWYFLVGTFNGAQSRMLIDTDGYGPVNNALNVGSSSPYIGARNNGGRMYPFRGIIDEFRVSNVPRSDAWLWASRMTVASNAPFTSYSPVRLSDALSIEALPATDIGAAGARLWGRLGNIGGVERPRVFFCLDSIDRGTVATSDWARVIGMGDAWGALESFSTNVTGLFPGSNYVVRCYATHSSAQAWSRGVREFQTVYLPAVTNPGAVERSVSTVLRGDVTDPGNETPAVWFHWWADGAAITHSLAMGNRDDAFEHALSGYDPAPLYHYHIQASNDAGSVWSQTESFRIPPVHWFVATNGNDTNAGTSWAAPFATIQKGIDSASAGQRIAVSNGTYTLSAQINLNKAVTVGSVNGAGMTVIDANAAWDAMRRCLAITHADAVLDGFTLTRGRLEIHLGAGAGIHMSAGSLLNCVISNCFSKYQQGVGGSAQGGGLSMAGGVASNLVVENCRAQAWNVPGYGGGIYMIGGLLVDSTVGGNTNRSWSAAGQIADGGGGIYMTGGTVRRTVVQHNQSSWGGGVYMAGGQIEDSWILTNNCSQSTLARGGGLYVGGGTVATSRVQGNYGQYLHMVGGYAHGGGVYQTGGLVRDCELIGNWTSGWTAGNGGGVYLDGAAGRMERCIVSSNVANAAGGGAQGNGGGVFLAAGTLRGCLIAGNGNTSGRYGGGVYATGGLVESSTLTGNRAATAGGGTWGGTCTNCIVFGNTAPGDPNYSGGSFAYSLASPGPPAGEGNTADDPLFLDSGTGYGVEHVAGNYRLSTESPAANAGTNLAWMLRAVDLDGNRRIDGRTVDMGAYEIRYVHGIVVSVK